MKTTRKQTTPEKPQKVMRQTTLYENPEIEYQVQQKGQTRNKQIKPPNSKTKTQGPRQHLTYQEKTTRKTNEHARKTTKSHETNNFIRKPRNRIPRF